MALDGVEHGVEAVGAGRGKVVGEADFTDKVGFGVDDLPCVAARIDLRQQAIRPETMAASLLARMVILSASPSRCNQTRDWQPASNLSSVFSSSANGGNFLPRSIRYW